MDKESFAAALRTALMQLDDIRGLSGNPLLPLLAGDSTASPFELQKILLDAIESLANSENPLAADAHEVLYFRYVEQLTQRDLAYQLGVSVRKLRYEQNNAIEFLAHLLLERLGPMQIEQGGLLRSNSDSDSTVEDEILALRERLGPGASEVSEEIRRAAQEGRILARHHQVYLGFSTVAETCRVAVPSPVLRQALLTVLSFAIPRSTRQTLDIEWKSNHLEVAITVRQSGRNLQTPDTETDRAALVTASQLLAPFGGRVTVAKTYPLEIQIALALTNTVPVLVVDDNPDTRKLYERYAENSRFRVITVADSSKIIELSQQFGVRAIVLDIMMPESDGWDALARLRHHPATRHIPIVVSTILPQQELAGLLAAAAFLQKPVSWQEFLAVLSRVTAEAPEPG